MPHCTGRVRVSSYGWSFSVSNTISIHLLKKIISVPFSVPLLDKHKYFRLNPALKCAMIGMQECRQASKRASKKELWMDKNRENH